MTFYDFQRLSPAEQYQAVFEQGAFLSARLSVTENEIALIVYRLGTFHVELRYHRTTNRLMGLRAFTFAKKLVSAMAVNQTLSVAG